MRRLPGVVVCAIVLLIGSLFQLLMAGLMSLAGAIQQHEIRSGVRLSGGHMATAPPPAWLPLFTYALSAFIVALAVWGIATAIGLFRARRWARYCILAIGGCVVLFSLPAMLMMLVLSFVPLPAPPSLDPSQVHTTQAVTKVIFVIMALLYALVCAVGVSWLVYFNRKNVRAAFANPAAEIAPSRRPFLISAIAVLSLFGAATCALMAILPIPGGLFGWVLHGWAKVAVMIAYALLLAAAGIGLWRLEEWGRRVALAMQGIGLAQYIVFLTWPSLLQRYIDEMHRAMNLQQPQALPAHFQSMLQTTALGFGIVFLMAIVLVLHHYRGAFRPPPGPAQPEAAVVV